MKDWKYQDYEDERDQALDVFIKETRTDKEYAMGRFQDLRDYANKLAYELARHTNYDVKPIEAAKKALKAQEYDDVIKQLDDMCGMFEGVVLDWQMSPADEFANQYERVEVLVGDGNHYLMLP